MEEDIYNYLPTVMFRGTSCILTRHLVKYINCKIICTHKVNKFTLPETLLGLNNDPDMCDIQ